MISKFLNSDIRKQYFPETSSVWRRLLRVIAPNYAWRWECPRTVEEVAEDFMRRHIGPEGIRRIAELPAPDFEPYNDPSFASRRRICSIYGVATHYDVPGRERGEPGWNRPLLADCRAKDPEAAVEEIFRRIWEKARAEHGISSIAPPAT